MSGNVYRLFPRKTTEYKDVEKSPKIGDMVIFIVCVVILGVLGVALLLSLFEAGIVDVFR